MRIACPPLELPRRQIGALVSSEIRFDTAAMCPPEPLLPEVPSRCTVQQTNEQEVIFPPATVGNRHAA